MRVVFVAPFGLRPKGTVSARALPLARALAARGHQMTVLVPPWDDRNAAGQVNEAGGVRVVNLPLPANPRLDAPTLMARLLRATLAARPAVVHCFKPKAYSGLLALAWWTLRRAGLVRAPFVVDSDDWEGPGGWNEREPYSGALKRLFAWQERWSLTHANGVTVASRALETLAWSLGASPARVCYLPNGPQPWPTADQSAVAARRAELGLGAAPVALLYTRFFEFDPGRFAAAWAQVVAAVPAVRLLVVGRGLAGEEQAFRAALEAAGVRHSMIDVGWQPPEALPVHWALARVALWPMDDTLINRTKCPVKLTDLVGAGLPVVAESVGQVTEYLAPDAGGVIVAPGDVQAFAAATVALLQAPERAAVLGAAGRARLAREFGWPLHAATAEALYRQSGVAGRIGPQA